MSGVKVGDLPARVFEASTRCIHSPVDSHPFYACAIGEAGKMQSFITFSYLCPYDTRTNQGYEGSDDRPGEVSLTSQTDDIKSMTKNSSR